MEIMDRRLIDYFDSLIIKHESEHGYISNFEMNYEEAKELFTEEELKLLVVFSAMKFAITTQQNSELMDISRYILEELEKAGLKMPISSEFINSIFNFNAVYRPLYDLLSLATNGKFRGKEMSQDYIDGVIDSILVLKKYQRSSGFGDFEWTLDFNTAVSNVPQENYNYPHKH